MPFIANTLSLSNKLFTCCIFLFFTSCAANPYFYPKQESDLKTAMAIIDEIAKKNHLELVDTDDRNPFDRAYKGILPPAFENWPIALPRQYVLCIASAPNNSSIAILGSGTHLRKEIIDALRQKFGKKSVFIGHDLPYLVLAP
jgi:hypothetical protein